MKFSPEDLTQIKRKGISIEELNQQLSLLQKGNQTLHIIKPALIGEGILALTDTQKEKYEKLFDKEKNQYSLEKFVPASGAASRMFKDWIFFLENYTPGKDYYKRFVKKHHLQNMEPEPEAFIDEISSYAFYEELMEVLKENEPGFFQLDENEQVWKLIYYILSEEGLNYKNSPKMLLKFHRYSRNNALTPMEEHAIEATYYTQNNQQKGKVHFSISPSHKNIFEAHKNALSHKYPVEIQFSFQKPETESLMTDEQGEIIRNKQGEIIFRPGGHGALLHNIQEMDSDIIFIKNIDNVQKGEKKKNTLLNKKILAGKMMELLNLRNHYLNLLDKEKPIGESLKEIENFAKNDLNIRFIEGYDTLNNSGKRKYLYYKLNRPLRVAGMVKNTGEPGGGPFWALDQNGIKSLQIIEKSQINLSDPSQKEVFESSTHFNPVDLVIHIKDHLGKKYDLQEFVNRNTAFISEKTYGSQKVKVYEYPGLWNGSMDGWNTVFIEVPLDTFSPVKTIKDLLKPAHY